MKKISLLLAILTLTIAAYAFESVNYDMAAEPKAQNIKKTGGKNVFFKDGMLSIRGGSFGFDLPVSEPCRLSFKFKNIGFSIDQKTGVESTMGFWRFGLTGENGKAVSIYAQGNKHLVCTFSQKGTVLFHKGGKISNLTTGKDVPWSTFELINDDKSTSIFINGASIMYYPGTLLPIKRIVFTPWRMFMDVKDFKVDPYVKQTRKTTQKPLFSLDFEDGFNAVNATGEKVSPSANSGFTLVEGVQGKALARDNYGKLKYPAEKLFNNSCGTVMFWGKCNGEIVKKVTNKELDGKSRNYTVLEAVDGSTNKLSAVMYKFFPTISFALKDSKARKNFVRNTQQKNDVWYHFALCYFDDGPTRLFVNGMPYVSGFLSSNRGGMLLNADLEPIKELVFRQRSYIVVDNVKIYDRPLTNAEVMDEYRSVMPIDLVMEDAVIEAGKPSAITLQAAPGGFFQRPNPVPDKPLVKADVTLIAKLFDKDGKLVAEETKDLKVDEKIDVKLKKLTLPVGLYNLACVVKYKGGNYRRSFPVYSENPVKNAAEASYDEWDVGKKFISVKFDDLKKVNWITGNPMIRKTKIGTYLEISENNHDRVAMEIKFPPEMIGKPCIMEFVWPDDKPRMTGLYMYRSKRGANRDRLGHIIQSGGEYPATGKMRTTRYTFMPGDEEYLFELRTAGTGYPAALAQLNIYEMDSKFPVLKIRTPEGLPGRRFGHYDEDQTFDQNMCYDTELPAEYAGRTPYVTSVLMNYMNYVGMNGFDYATYRYQYGYDVVEGSAISGMYPYGIGQLRYVLDTFAANNKKFTGIIQPLCVPQLKQFELTDNDYEKKGMFLLDNYGNKAWHGKSLRHNPSNPEVQKLLFENYRNILANYANHPALEGLVVSDSTLGWGKLEYGYDDYSVGKFSKDTGIIVPDGFEARYTLLNGPKRAQWLKWRSKQITGNVANYRKLMDEYNPKLKLYVMLDNSIENYEVRGVDVAAIKKLKGVEAALKRTAYGYRWNCHRDYQESDRDFLYYNFNNPEIKLLRENGGVPRMHIFETYFETRISSPYNKKYPCYFQCPNGKPVGRYYLKEPAFDVGALDVLNFMIGGQTMSPHGVEKEAREFAQAFCALPALPFNQVPGVTDPALARSLSTKNGTYFYVVNMSFFPVTVKLDFDNKDFLGFGKMKYTDLSTGKKLSGGKIKLLPFQLRSFLSLDKTLKITSASVVNRSQEAEEYFEKRIAELERAATTLEENKISCVLERKAIKEIQLEVAAGHWANAHRLAFEPMLNQMIRKHEEITNPEGRG